VRFGQNEPSLTEKFFGFFFQTDPGAFKVKINHSYQFTVFKNGEMTFLTIFKQDF
jgi:hypothetical protein